MTGRLSFACARRLTAVLMTVLLLGGCSTWRLQGLAPAAVVSSSRTPPTVRVTLQDGKKVAICRAVVEGDSLAGADPASPSHRVAVALSDIRAIDKRVSSTGKTVLLVAGLTIVVGGAIALVVLAESTADLGF